jgi:hypothetical protein
MLKRYVPLQVPNDIATTFELPSTYIGGDITLFINGQLLATRNDTEHPFGYTLDETNKNFTFYTAPQTDDFIYVLYDDSGEGTGGSGGDGAIGSGVIRIKHGYSLISYPGATKAKWDKNQQKIVYPEDTLANVQNLIIDQIEQRYGVPASDIIREIQTYRDDVGQYRLYMPGITGTVWTNNGEHVTNTSLFRPADANDYGDPNFGNNVFYNPDNFILSNCSLDTDDITVISNDDENPIQDLPMGQRSGIHIYIYPDADLSKTNNLLEIYF